MIVLSGISACSGLVRAPAYVFLHTPVVVEKEKILPGQAPQEKRRFRDALETAKQETRGSDGTGILDAHAMMLSDPSFIRQVEQEIDRSELCAPWAVEVTIDRMTELLLKTGDGLLQERIDDFKDVATQLIAIMQGSRRESLASFGHDVVLVADTLLPSEFFSMDKAHVCGIALDQGGPTSHVAILARASGIPTVLGLGSISANVQTGQDVIVNATGGKVAVDPDPVTVRSYEQKARDAERTGEELRQLASLPSVTEDGRAVHLLSNIETIAETTQAKDVGCEGVGLYRSEYLILDHGENVSEEIQLEAYRAIVEKMAPLPVTIRTFDVGGDKAVPGLGIDEKNPILGWRAVRFCLARKDIFLTQLRALLRASAYGKLRIMFPMISGVGELEDVLSVLDEAKAQLDKEGIPYDHAIRTGTMIEVPSAALCADLLARHVDFFSIGTNDLIQYTLAVDRGNEKIAYLYQPCHPAVLRAIRMTVQAAHAAKIPVGMCGEMAGDPAYAVLLAGLGLDELSMDPQSMLQVRRIIRSIRQSDAEAMVEEAMRKEQAEEIEAFVRRWTAERVSVRH